MLVFCSHFLYFVLGLYCSSFEHWRAGVQDLNEREKNITLQITALLVQISGLLPYQLWAKYGRFREGLVESVCDHRSTTQIFDVFYKSIFHSVLLFFSPSSCNVSTFFLLVKFYHLQWVSHIMLTNICKMLCLRSVFRKKVTCFELTLTFNVPVEQAKAEWAPCPCPCHW